MLTHDRWLIPWHLTWQGPVALTIDTCGSGFDTELYVFSPDGSTLNFCDDCGPCGTRTVLTTNVPAQGLYQVELTGWAGNVGPYTLSTTCALGQTPPLPMTCNQIYSGTTTAATPKTNYSFVVGTAGGAPQEVTLSTCASAFDTMLTVFDAANNQVSFCDDCGPCGTRVILELTLDPGT